MTVPMPEGWTLTQTPDDAPSMVYTLTDGGGWPLAAMDHEGITASMLATDEDQQLIADNMVEWCVAEFGSEA